MWLEANVGFLIHAPEKMKRKFPQLKAVGSHSELLKLIKKAMASRWSSSFGLRHEGDNL